MFFRDVAFRFDGTASFARRDMARASIKNTRPASVSRKDFGTRSRSKKPSTSSNSRICWLNAGCETCSFCAARDILLFGRADEMAENGAVSWAAKHSQATGDRNPGCMQLTIQREGGRSNLRSQTNET